MPLPYGRPWLLEISDQPWCPPYLRDPVRDMLTFLWTHRVPPFQHRAPYEGAVEVLNQVVDEIETYDRDNGIRGETMRIVDFGSGAGGPVRKVEAALNERRLADNNTPVPVSLSDIHPVPSAISDSTSPTLSYIHEPVNAFHAPKSVSSLKHLRTFFLSFHHFNNDHGRQIIADSMRSAEALCIFELQECNLGSAIMILMLAPLTWILTPLLRPSAKTLFFTYLIPLIPLILVFDGLVSVYRTRTPKQILYLAKLANLSLALEGEAKDNGDTDWRWEYGYKRHTWPFGRLSWVVGRRDRRDDPGATETETETEGEWSEAETGHDM
ncbi:hypothetical protein L202_02851 [Cryptococcus amylolentus CBS 6039]|uniref:Uncharacterized protein n=1 Tax=Cryptococcus amylolentus CBS 6039 TaxID=1295533 RepID=A0A1E3HWL1_9TREE|nr:hypothetical protein L202_02851 [Cryptococcus amylolentus CBS 6039]ODN80677.1 hypothetical protein L202_02851 [Cryptococcus amylolentus CBS 6039]